MHAQQKFAPQCEHLTWLHPPALEIGTEHEGHGRLLVVTHREVSSSSSCFDSVGSTKDSSQQGHFTEMDRNNASRALLARRKFTAIPVLAKT
mmetsp:Transcript_16112/g.40387  ORF Transcript_16112/g.40387 Transcript_16112/m.40387 type:complete len:92 (-) Transcript_16112:929-1204(-)